MTREATSIWLDRVEGALLYGGGFPTVGRSLAEIASHLGQPAATPAMLLALDLLAAQGRAKRTYGQAVELWERTTQPFHQQGCDLGVRVARAWQVAREHVAKDRILFEAVNLKGDDMREAPKQKGIDAPKVSKTVKLNVRRAYAALAAKAAATAVLKVANGAQGIAEANQLMAALERWAVRAGADGMGSTHFRVPQ